MITELEKIRTARGLNRVDMAAEIGFSKNTYYRWCNGQPPRNISLIELANAYLEGFNGVER
jgi:DNA-binding XRE family transcriptional regulator